MNRDSKLIPTTSIQIMQTPKMNEQKFFKKNKNIFDGSMSQRQTDSKKITSRSKNRSEIHKLNHISDFNCSNKKLIIKENKHIDSDKNNSSGQNKDLSQHHFSIKKKSSNMLKKIDCFSSPNKRNFNVDLIYDPEIINKSNQSKSSYHKNFIPSSKNTLENKENYITDKKLKKKSRSKKLISNSHGIYKIISPKFPRPQSNNSSKIKTPFNQINQNNIQFYQKSFQNPEFNMNNMPNTQTYQVLKTRSTKKIKKVNSNDHLQDINRCVTSPLYPTPLNPNDIALKNYQKNIKSNFERTNTVHKENKILKEINMMYYPSVVNPQPQKRKKKKFISHKNYFQKKNQNSFDPSCMFSLSKKDLLKIQKYKQNNNNNVLNKHLQESNIITNKQNNYQTDFFAPYNNIQVQEEILLSQNNLSNYSNIENMQDSFQTRPSILKSPNAKTHTKQNQKLFCSEIGKNYDDNDHIQIYSQNVSRKYSQPRQSINPKPTSNPDADPLLKDLKDMTKSDFKVIFDLLDQQKIGKLKRNNFRFSFLPLKTMNHLEPIIKEMLINDSDVDFNTFSEMLMGLIASLN